MCKVDGNYVAKNFWTDNDSNSNNEEVEPNLFDSSSPIFAVGGN